MIRNVIKQTSRWMIDGPAFHQVACALERQDRQPNRLRVLTYHRVLPTAEHSSSHSGLVSASPEGFRQQIDFLVENYAVVALEEVMAAIETGQSLPPHAVLLTFDDAYTDFEQYAWPVLRDRRLPVTVFVPTAFPDRPSRCFWWDRIYHACLHTAATVVTDIPMGPLSLKTPQERTEAAESLNRLFKSLPHRDASQMVEQIWGELAPPPLVNSVLGWDALRRLRQEGVTLAPHTCTHPLLNRLPIEAALDEAAQSYEDLRRQVGETLPVLAYPGGGHTLQLADELRKVFTVAFSTRRGINEIGVTDPLRLHRINVGRKTTVGSLRVQMLACAGILHRQLNKKQLA